MPKAESSLQLHSTVTSGGALELALVDVPRPQPGPDDVLIRVEAAPINPSDLGLLLAGADITTAKVSGSADRPVVTAEVTPAVLKTLTGRLDQSLPVGNEGAGVVVEAGSSVPAQALIGRTVAVAGGQMYGQFRCAPAGFCLVLPEGTTPKEGASCFVNPLTVLGMLETLKQEGHEALVHTAAASNLGQMLQKACLADGVPLVNIVRRPEQAELLQGLGANHVCNSTSATFMGDLIDAVAETRATLAFDATGGGKLASQILTAMEAAASREAGAYSRYGSTRHKQVYLYGGLDRSPTELTRNFGMAWGIGGWLLLNFMTKAGLEVVQRMRDRVANEIKTTFASTYTQEVSLAEALSLDAIASYGKQATGEKYLITPQRGLQS